MAARGGGLPAAPAASGGLASPPLPRRARALLGAGATRAPVAAADRSGLARRLARGSRHPALLSSSIRGAVTARAAGSARGARSADVAAARALAVGAAGGTGGGFGSFAEPAGAGAAAPGRWSPPSAGSFARGCGGLTPARRPRTAAGAASRSRGSSGRRGAREESGESVAGALEELAAERNAYQEASASILGGAPISRPEERAYDAYARGEAVPTAAMGRAELLAGTIKRVGEAQRGGVEIGRLRREERKARERVEDAEQRANDENRDAEDARRVARQEEQGKEKEEEEEEDGEDVSDEDGDDYLDEEEEEDDDEDEEEGDDDVIDSEEEEEEEEEDEERLAALEKARERAQARARAAARGAQAGGRSRLLPSSSSSSPVSPLAFLASPLGLAASVAALGSAAAAAAGVAAARRGRGPLASGPLARLLARAGIDLSGGPSLPDGSDVPDSPAQLFRARGVGAGAGRGAAAGDAREGLSIDGLFGWTPGESLRGGGGAEGADAGASGGSSSAPPPPSSAPAPAPAPLSMTEETRSLLPRLATQMRFEPRVSLRGTVLGDEGLSYLAESLAFNDALESLDLSFTSPERAGVERLAVALRSNAHLERLALEGCGLDADEVATLVWGLSGDAQVALPGEDAEDAGADASPRRRPADRAAPTPLRELSLAQCPIGDRGVDVLCRHLLGSADGAQGEAEEGCDGAGADASAPNAARGGDASALSSPSALVRLDLTACSLTAEGAEAVGRALASPSCRLRSLALGRNTLGLRGALALAEGLERCTSLEHLDLRSTALTPRGSAAVLAALARRAPGLRRLDLGNVGAGVDAGRALGDLLRRHASLERLSLGMNDLGDVGAISLGGAMGAKTWRETEGAGAGGDPDSGSPVFAAASSASDWSVAAFRQAARRDAAGGDAASAKEGPGGPNDAPDALPPPAPSPSGSAPGDASAAAPPSPPEPLPSAAAPSSPPEPLPSAAAPSSPPEPLPSAAAPSSPPEPLPSAAALKRGRGRVEPTVPVSAIPPPDLEPLDPASDPPPAGARLTHLDLSSNGVGAPGARALAAGVTALARRCDPALRTLDLSHDALGAGGAAALAEALLSAGELSDLGLAFTRVGPGPAARALAELVAFSRSLRRLSLRGAELGDDGVRALAGGLRARGGGPEGDAGASAAPHVPLAELDVAYNDVGDKGAFALASAFKANPAFGPPDATAINTNRLTRVGQVVLQEAAEDVRDQAARIIEITF